MDSSPILGVVANALQLAEIGGKLVGGAVAFAGAHDDTSRTIIDLEQVTSNLSNISEGLKTIDFGPTRFNLSAPFQSVQLKEDQLAIRSLAKDCKTLADDLLSALYSLKRKPGKRRWRVSGSHLSHYGRRKSSQTTGVGWPTFGPC